MKTSALVLLSFLLATAAGAQVLSYGFGGAPAPSDPLDPLRNVSGTTASPGSEAIWNTTSDGAWRGFAAYAAHVTYVSESGPEEQRNDTFSTNWLVAGAERRFGRGFLLLRARASAEPWTAGDEGYPQMLQYVPGTVPPLVDSMRPRRVLEEAAIHAGWRPSASMLLHVYAAPIGDPALGAAPDGLRASSAEFAEAPFAWAIQESFHSATKVVTAGFGTRWIAVDASVFHSAAESDADYSSVDFDGDIDSRSARITVTPSTNWALQVSRGELGEDVAERTITSASVSWGAGPAAATAMWTQREHESGFPTETAYGFELLLRANRHSWMGRAEWVDRPATFPDFPSEPPADLFQPLEQTTHFTVGYIYDYVSRDSFRSGFGVNVDYHTQSHELPARYGHKPQSIYAFLRFRS